MTILKFAGDFMATYEAACKPLCQEIHMPQTAFDILMFLANNPQYATARDIVEVRKLKANLVSINVDKLAREGYLERREVPGDRRKTRLALTDKAGDIVRRGRALQARFADELFAGVDEGDREAFWRVTAALGENLAQLSAAVCGG